LRALVWDMVDGGVKWGEANYELVNKVTTGTEIRFNFRDRTFQKFYDTTYTNRVNKLKEILAD
jgi:hypothetical protein